jgi:hypothetical protein
MLASTLFVRVVPADKGRGFVLLAGYDAAVVQRTALQYTTLTVVTRESLNAAVERMRLQNSAAAVRDVTAPAIAKKLAKMFGETPAQAAPPVTFSNLGVGSYLP